MIVIRNKVTGIYYTNAPYGQNSWASMQIAKAARFPDDVSRRWQAWVSSEGQFKQLEFITVGKDDVLDFAYEQKHCPWTPPVYEKDENGKLVRK